MPIIINWTTDFTSLRHLEFVEWAVVPIHRHPRHTLDDLKQAFGTAFAEFTNLSPTFVFTYHDRFPMSDVEWVGEDSE
jgi:hypothetical protein